MVTHSKLIFIFLLVGALGIPTTAQDAPERPADTVTFEPAVLVSEGSSLVDPFLSADASGHVIVGWSLAVGIQDQGIYTNLSRDGARTFSQASLLSLDSLGEGSFARTENALFLAHRWPYGNAIEIDRSSDGGKSWQGWSVINHPHAEAMYRPSLAVDQKGSLHAVYTTNKKAVPLWHRMSTDGGLNWSAPNLISFNAGHFAGDLAGDLRVTHSGALALAARDNLRSMGVIYVSRNDGAVWRRYELPHSQVSAGGYPLLDAHNDDLYAVWVGSINQGVWFARLRDAQETVDDPVQVSRGDQRTMLPTIAVDRAGGVHITFLGERADHTWSMFYARSVDQGKTFSEPKPLTDLAFSLAYVPGAFFHSRIAGDNLHVAWILPGSPSAVYVSTARNIVK